MGFFGIYGIYGIFWDFFVECTGFFWSDLPFGIFTFLLPEYRPTDDNELNKNDKQSLIFCVDMSDVPGELKSFRETEIFCTMLRNFIMAHKTNYKN